MHSATRKKLYRYFTWVHSNSNGIPVVIGSITGVGIKLFETSLLKEKQNEYYDYVSHMYNS